MRHKTLLIFIVFFLIESIYFLFPQSTKAQTANFIKTSGTKFTLNNQEFKFVGFNLFDAAATSQYKCAWWPAFTDQELDNALKNMKTNGGANVLRFWAFQSYTQGGTDWSGIDRVIRIAKDNGFYVLPVLENGPGHCELGNNNQAKWQYNNDSWYSTGYKSKYGSFTLTYPEYVERIVTRYKDEPTIMAWSLINEADTSRRTNGSTDCRGGGQSVLVPFATDIAGKIKAIDINHLVTVGTQSNGACGGSGTDFDDLYSLPNVDFGTIHDYGYWADPGHTDWKKGELDPLPGSTDGITLPSLNSSECQRTYEARLACSIASAMQVVQKPVVITESGVSLDRFSLSERAATLDKKINASFKNGVSGYIVWQWNKIVDTEKFDVLGTNNDPLLDIMKTHSTSTTAKQGDANGDTKVDGLDYIIWLNHYNQNTTRGVLDGDFDTNGKVDGQDYIRWLNNYGT